MLWLEVAADTATMIVLVAILAGYFGTVIILYRQNMRVKTDEPIEWIEPRKGKTGPAFVSIGHNKLVINRVAMDLIGEGDYIAIGAGKVTLSPGTPKEEKTVAIFIETDPDDSQAGLRRKIWRREAGGMVGLTAATKLLERGRYYLVPATGRKQLIFAKDTGDGN